MVRANKHAVESADLYFPKSSKLASHYRKKRKKWRNRKRGSWSCLASCDRVRKYVFPFFHCAPLLGRRALPNGPPDEEVAQDAEPVAAGAGPGRALVFQMPKKRVAKLELSFIRFTWKFLKQASPSPRLRSRQWPRLHGFLAAIDNKGIAGMTSGGRESQ